MSGLLIAAQFAALDSAPIVHNWRDSRELLFTTMWHLHEARRVTYLCNGAFDLLHAGHVDMFHYVRNHDNSRNNFVIAAVNSDQSVKRLKGNDRPFVLFHERLKMLAALRYVDLVVGFEEDTPVELAEVLRPKYVAKGAEYRDSTIPGSHFAANGVFWVPMMSPEHTTNVARRIAAAVHKQRG